MKHCMRLQHAPFLAIKAGRKRIEMRLNDDKRSLIKVGDSVEFTDVLTQETLVCKVLQLHKYASFDELYLHHDKLSLGYEEEENANPDDMLVYYPKAEVEKYGVLGIELDLL